MGCSHLLMGIFVKRSPYGESWVTGVVETASTARPTRTAPVCRRTSHTAVAVEPVVSTSSTTRTAFPAHGQVLPAGLKAPCRFCRRPDRSSFAWWPVLRVRTRALDQIGVPSCSATPCAMAAAWLYPRSRRRALWSGIGTTPSKVAVTCPARRRPNGAPSSSRPLNFRWCIASRRAPVWSPIAQARPNPEPFLHSLHSSLLRSGFGRLQAGQRATAGSKSILATQFPHTRGRGDPVSAPSHSRQVVRGGQRSSTRPRTACTNKTSPPRDEFPRRGLRER